MKVNLPGFIYAPRKTFKVEDRFNSKDFDSCKGHRFQDGKGYVDEYDDHVWVYCKSKPKNDLNLYPYFWREGNDFVKSKPSPDTYRIFGVDEIRSLTTTNIINEAIKNPENNSGFNDDVINDLNASSEKFHPVMYATDDFLKKIIKSVINDLDISLSKYKYKVEQKYMVSNMKSSLIMKTKTSPTYFNAWTEMLGIKTIIIAYSDDTAEDKLSEPMVYLSERDSVFKLSEVVEEVVKTVYDELTKAGKINNNKK